MINESILISILSKTASDTEQKVFQEWIKSSSENKETFKSYETLWNKLESTDRKPIFNKEKAKLNIQKTILKTANKNIFKKRIIAFSIAASIAILIGFSFSYHSISNNLKYTTSYTALSENKRIILEDSSIVWLNRNSSIKLAHDFNTKKRELELYGEAFFEVKRNEEKPFIISCGDTKTKVLGTSFNIKNDSSANNITLTVKSGVVLFKTKGLFTHSEIVKANKQCSYQSNQKSLTLSDHINPNYLSWKTNKLQFNNVPINKVCEQLSAHYKTIIKTNNLNTALKLTGNFKDESLENILTTIAISMDVKFDTINQEIHLVNY